jgi:hypothetical protein
MLPNRLLNHCFVKATKKLCRSLGHFYVINFSTKATNTPSLSLSTTAVQHAYVSTHQRKTDNELSKVEYFCFITQQPIWSYSMLISINNVAFEELVPPPNVMTVNHLRLEKTTELFAISSPSHSISYECKNTAINLRNAQMVVTYLCKYQNWR